MMQGLRVGLRPLPLWFRSAMNLRSTRSTPTDVPIVTNWITWNLGAMRPMSCTTSQEMIELIGFANSMVSYPLSVSSTNSSSSCNTVTAGVVAVGMSVRRCGSSDLS